MGKPVNKTLRIAAMSAGEEIGHASGPVVTFRGNSAPLRSLLVNIDPVQAGTGDPSPDNVRPISGWSAVNVWRTGSNVWDEEWENGYISGGIEYGSNECIRSKNYNPVVPNTTYYLYCGSATNEYFVRPNFYDADKNFISDYAWCANGTFTTPENCFYVRLGTQSASTAKYGGTYLNDISINYPATDHDYHPYSGNQYTIQLGQTIYGGTLDVTNGVLTVDWVYKAFDGTENTWVRSSRYNGSFYVETGFALVLDPSLNFAICSHAVRATTFPINYAFGKFGFDGQSNNPYFNVWIAAANTSLDDFKTYLAGQAQNGTPVSFCCKLATPITYQLTPQEISTLQGQNNVWADSGDVDVEYVSTGGEGGKLALLLRNRKELLIALRKGLSPAEVGLLGSIPSFGGSLSPGVIRPGLNTQEEEEDENKDA